MAIRPASPWYYAGASGGITDTTAIALAAAAGAGLKNWLSGLQYQNTSTTASEIVIKDGTTVVWRGTAPASMTYPANLTFDPPLQSSANAALNVAMVTTGSATVVSAQGFVSP